MNDLFTLLEGDAVENLRTLETGSVQCCVTSPPFWGLRDYGHNGQLGLEKTPEEYVAKMVEVFREVRRVLRKDGTLWLNLGDSYSGSGEGGGGNRKGNEHGQHDVMQGKRGDSGLKPKDLCGIPWRVARSLQEPYYTGKIKDERDRVWLAAMIDAEGCMFLHKRKTGQSNGQGYTRKNDSYGASLEVANTSELIVKRCMEITGRGSIFKHEKDRRLPLFRWSMRSNECREVIREIYPHLTSKLQQARILLNCPSSGEEAAKCHRSMIALHNGKEPCIDYDTPPSLFEKGWYLRSDIIWSKLNPMPESVTDRPTKSHEYLFLLTKSANYFYDAEAIKEQNAPATIERAKYGWCSPDTKASKYQGMNGLNRDEQYPLSENGRNKRSVWTVATAPYPEAHFATYPPDLIKPCIMAGTSAKGCCAKCGAPWERIVEREQTKEGEPYDSRMERWGNEFTPAYQGGRSFQVPIRYNISQSKSETLGWQPTCECDAPVEPCVCLDPFAGSGTTGMVAIELGRKAILIELNPKYCDLIRQRCDVTPGLQLA